MSFKEIPFLTIHFENEKPEESSYEPASPKPVTQKKPKERHIKKSGSFMRRDRRNNSRLKPKKTPE